MKRFWRTISVLGVVTSVVLLVYVLLLPVIAKSAVIGLLEDSGLTDSTTNISSVSPWALQMNDVAIGKDDRIHCDSVIVTYEPIGLSGGRVNKVRVINGQWDIHVRDGKIDWGFESKSSEKSKFDPGVDSIVFDSLMLVVHWEDRTYRVPARGSVVNAGMANLKIDLLVDLLHSSVPVTGDLNLISGDVKVGVNVDRVAGSPELLRDLDVQFQQTEASAKVVASVSGDGWKLSHFQAEMAAKAVDDEKNRVDITWLLAGKLPRWLQKHAADVGVDVLDLGSVKVSGAGIAKYESGKVLESLQIDVSKLNVSVPRGDVSFPWTGMDMLHTVIDMDFKGVVTRDAMALTVIPGGTFDVGQLRTESVSCDNVNLAVDERESQPLLGVRFASEPGDEPRVRVAGVLKTTMPVTLNAGPVDCSLDQASVSVSAAIHDDRPLSIDGEVHARGPRFNHADAELRMSDFSLRIPVTLNSGDVDPGEFQIGSVLWRKTNMGRIEGAARSVDMGIDAKARWQLTDESALSAHVAIGTDGEDLIDLKLPMIELAGDGPIEKALADNLGIDLRGKVSLNAIIPVENRPSITIDVRDLTLASNDWDASVEGVRGSVRINSLVPLTSPGSQRLSMTKAKLGELELGEGDLRFHIESAKRFFVERARWNWGPSTATQGIFRIHGFRVDFDDPIISTEVFAEQLQVSTWLELITGGKVTGDGLLNGRWPVSFRPNEKVKLRFDRGFLYAKPVKGSIRVLDKKVVTDHIRAGDALNEMIARAAEDFEYWSLTFDFIERDKDIQMRLTARGQGKQGDNPLPIDPLTININNFGHLVNLALIKARSGSSQPK